MATLHEEEVKLTKLWFFHPEVDSHMAQALLLQGHISVGTFLVRHRANKKGYAVSVKAGKDDVKNFEMSWTGAQFEFGHGIYRNTEELEFHFKNKPLIGGHSGMAAVLTEPYPKDVEEPSLYSVVQMQAEGGEDTENNNDIGDFSINNKAGYLTKLGSYFKNWKIRWFVMNNNELKYFKDASHKVPIRVIDLNECTSCDVCIDPKITRKNTFSLVLPWRTFQLSASSEQEMNEWLNVIHWKLEHRRN